MMIIKGFAAVAAHSMLFLYWITFKRFFFALLWKYLDNMPADWVFDETLISFLLTITTYWSIIFSIDVRSVSSSLTFELNFKYLIFLFWKSCNIQMYFPICKFLIVSYSSTAFFFLTQQIFRASNWRTLEFDQQKHLRHSKKKENLKLNKLPAITLEGSVKCKKFLMFWGYHFWWH